MHSERSPEPSPRSFSQIDRQLPIGPQVYAAVREAILNVRLAPGMVLSEQTLAAELGVSRTPVREAILRLTREGLVVVYAPVSYTHLRAHET